MRTILFFNNLVLIFSLFQTLPGNSKQEAPLPMSQTQYAEAKSAPAGMAVSLRAATGATILFRSENNSETNSPRVKDNRIPHLVLNRNSVPTPNFERTLHINLENLIVPPSGLYARLVIETEHGDPDLGGGTSNRIRAWEETKFIPYAPDSQSPRSNEFSVLFQRTFKSQGKSLRTPTDYYSYQLTLTDGKGTGRFAPWLWQDNGDILALTVPSQVGLALGVWAAVRSRAAS